MALFNKIGNILKQTSQKLPSLESSFPNGSLYQAIRCFSSSKLFIGGLSFATDENSLREAFLPYGDVVEARIIFDRESGRSRGFGFVSYPSAEEASSAIQALDGKDLHGRLIRVVYAADQRHPSHGPNFSGAVGYGDSFRGSDGYGTVTSHAGGTFSGRYGNHADGGSYNSDGNAGFGSTGDYSNDHNSRPDVGKHEGFSANGNGRATYTAENGMNIGHDSFRTQDVSNRAGGHYLHSAGDNFGGNSGCEAPGNFSGSGHGNGNADSYNTTNVGANSFNNRTPYNGMR